MEQTRYSHISAEGNARQQNGHVYNNTGGHSASGEARQHIGNVSNNWTYNYTPRKRKSDDTLRENERSQTLLTAAAEGQRPRVNYLLSRGVNIDWNDDQGFTALHHACLSGFEDVVQILLEGGADVNAQSLDFGTPLCLAALRGRENVVEMLVKYRASVHKAGLWVGTPLHCACYIGSVEVSAILLKKGASSGRSSTLREPFLKHGCCATFARALTASSSEVGRKHRLLTCGAYYIAARRGHQALVTYLLEVDQYVDATNQLWKTDNPVVDCFEDVSEYDKTSGVTALMAASKFGHPQVAKILISNGANVDLKDSYGSCALSYAADGQSRKCLDCVRILLEAKADINSRDMKLCTPLFGAIRSNNITVTRELLERGAEIDVSDSDGETPSYLAVDEGRLEIFQMLVERKPDLSRRGTGGYTALHVAVKRGYPEITKSLLAAGADTSVQNNKGRTPLHLAVIESNISITRLLLESGASIAIKDDHGKVAADYCVAGSEIYELLSSNASQSHDPNAGALPGPDSNAPRAYIERTIDMLDDADTFLSRLTGLKYRLEAMSTVKRVREQLVVMGEMMPSSSMSLSLRVTIIEHIKISAFELKMELEKLFVYDKDGLQLKARARWIPITYEFKIRACVSDVASSMERVSSLWQQIENHATLATLQQEVAELTEQKRALMERQKEMERRSSDVNEIHGADTSPQEHSGAGSLQHAERAQSVSPRLLGPAQDSSLRDDENRLEPTTVHGRDGFDDAEGALPEFRSMRL